MLEPALQKELHDQRLIFDLRLNLGQLAMLMRARYLVPAISFPKVKGKPFKISELTAKMNEVYED